MNDRQLLELAAKAAGIDARRLPDAWPNRFDDDQWNPLIDDGDALRLAVKLSIFDGDSFLNFRLLEIRETPSQDDFSATRRAIVRAAAEIGKEMA